MNFKPNMGSTDKIVRYVLAVIFVLVGLFVKGLPTWLSILLIVFAVVFVVTSVISFCPLYLPFGIRTNKK